MAPVSEIRRGPARARRTDRIEREGAVFSLEEKAVMVMVPLPPGPATQPDGVVRSGQRVTTRAGFRSAR